MANIITMMLNDEPQHPNKSRLLEMLREHTRIAEMDDEAFRTHELTKANPVYKLTQDEKLRCIRVLPVPIVKKLFPYL